MIISGYSVATVTDWILIALGVSHRVARKESVILGVWCITYKTAGKTFSSTENAKETALDMAWPGGQKFSE